MLTDVWKNGIILYKWEKAKQATNNEKKQRGQKRKRRPEGCQQNAKN
jgi:hypothetical protein